MPLQSLFHYRLVYNLIWRVLVEKDDYLIQRLAGRLRIKLAPYLMFIDIRD